MKRRIFAMALAAAMILSLAACGSKPGGGSSSNPGSSSVDSSNSSSNGSSSQSDGSGSQGDISEPASVTLNENSVTLDKAGASFQLQHFTGPEPNQLPTFSSSDEAVATVDGKGTITAVAPGTATITATYKDASATCTVICDWTDVTLSLNRTNVTLKKAGATFKLRCTTDPEIDATPTFTSSDEKVATVDKNGTIKAVAPGKATITVECGGATASAKVNCDWKAESTEPDTSKPSGGSSNSSSSSSSSGSSSSTVDLSAFYSAITGKYEFGFLELADSSILDNVYPGLSGISAEQMLVYVCMISMNNGEFGLVQVKDSKDVDAVKAAFQSRIDYMVGDGNGPGGAQYPMAMDQWENNSRIVSNGNYVMMIVHENCDDIVNEFNALF